MANLLQPHRATISRSDSNASFLSQPANLALCIELVPEYISLRLRSISCNGLHDKTEVRVKLQGVQQSTTPAKNLGDHTHKIFDFQTTVHNMTFDIIKIDVYDLKPLKRHKIGRAYLPLRDLQKKVGNKYDNDGDDGTEPEQSVLSNYFDTAAFCKKHDDIFEFDLPLFKHGSYSKFGSSRRDRDNLEKGVIVTKGSEVGKDISVLEHPHPLVHSDSFAQQAMNGVEVGMITVQATLHFNEQTASPLLSNLGRGKSVSLTTTTSVAEYGSIQRGTTRRARVNSNRSMDSSNSSDSSNTLTRSHSDQNLTSETEDSTPSSKAASTPIHIPKGNRSGDQQARILKIPLSPPNLSLHYASDGSPRSPLSPPMSPASSTSPFMSSQLMSDNNHLQSTLQSWDESDLSHGDDVADGDDLEYEDETCNDSNDHIKGEHLTDADRKREEELMANIMANGDQAKKDLYLNRLEDGQGKGYHSKHKKPKFSLFAERTVSAFKDIQLIYSSFFGHGWNLTRSEFLKGFHFVEQYYSRHPTPTTNKAFDNIEILEKARHFVRLAIASYGSLPWVYFGYSYKAAPLNFVRLNSDRKNVMDYFKLKKEDMIVWHFDKRTALVPSFYIVRDPKYNALCIIIRGTFSITDAMTDLVCEYYPYKGGLVHKGIMDNARFVLEHSGKDIEAALKKFNLKTIYCIGHSLGAGSASLLCSLLQDRFANYVVPTTSGSAAQKLEVKAYLYAPPPICTPNLAEEWERTQIAFVNENDIVCRLSYGNALDLKELIKIAALENENPAYAGLDSKEKTDRIVQILDKARESLLTVNDIPRLVIGGTVTYIHKVYEDTPVIQNKRHDRSSKFGLPENWSEDMYKQEGQDDTETQHSLARSLSSTLSLKRNKSKIRRQDPSPSDDRGSLYSNSSSGSKAAKVTPYQPNQPPVRLESPISLVSNVDTKQTQESGQPPQKSIGEPIHYTGPSNARDLASQRILDDSRQGKMSDTQAGADQDKARSKKDDDDDDDDERKVYTTQKPRKNGSKKKEIRIEFSDKEHFTAIPLRTNWLWHHFPQQYDSRIERALAWATAHKEKEDKKQRRRQREANGR
ncbi:hypothetical protein BGX31_007788 [Mortierella sp. GBA43]|nr:hypothetical protein BGX31_007788 [Mortierella sp. GBA43]